ncbi:Os09g0562950 [Oryza sativa Japonica Group]|uniref:Os09g0562950 protein n=1 Tax=Oryza sativa subsp. japonica TaxID=39947 RepID=A0A0N7KR98_ORYSJ|nr:Os09g0562950 [Oryza sativa Japonica Group]
MTLEHHRCRSGQGQARFSPVVHHLLVYHRCTIAPPPSKPSSVRGHHCTGAPHRLVSKCCHLIGLRLHQRHLLLRQPPPPRWPASSCRTGTSAMPPRTAATSSTTGRASPASAVTGCASAGALPLSAGQPPSLPPVARCRRVALP